MLARTPKAEIRMLMRLVTWTSSMTTSVGGSGPNESAPEDLRWQALALRVTTSEELEHEGSGI
ncbi:hypothetical protein DC74_52 [Streptomyces noursei]|uniref:Uncharacterized protein n=1 Tax=Streptomyces noursei TaxID=1971 RepID=A0A059VT89_STRNR|nr:hypothetical protein DC74_52 [Streptomyces noursei]GCB88184.1 hypothetical protein SALB_00853 [Streptomyces noursei]